MTFTLKSGPTERRWFEATGAPIHSGDGAAGGVLVIRDITDRSLRRLEEEFMATASHELRTPVAALHGYLQLLERHIDPAANETAAGYARNALTQTRRVGHLLDRLFDLARLQTGSLDVQLEPLDIVPVVHAAVASARTLTTDHEFDVAIETPSLLVLADPGRLEQVLLNLLTNAVVHAPESRRIEARVAREGESATVEIRDHGAGIPAAVLARLFSRFPGTGQGDGRGRKGLGLGLYITRQLMRAQGGSIKVTSTEGEGTTATIRLPLLTGVRPPGSRDKRPPRGRSAATSSPAGEPSPDMAPGVTAR
jgi:two-component system CheB/CheR fusion protein